MALILDLPVILLILFQFDRETAVILEAELKKRKELFSHFDFTVENIPITRFPAALSTKYGS